jgi:hypothetical protein
VALVLFFAAPICDDLHHPVARPRSPLECARLPRLRRLTALPAALLACALWAPAVAGAREVPSDQTEQELSSLLAEAHDAYDDLDLDVADGALAHAVVIARSRGYSGRVLGEIHLLRALIIYARDKDEKATTEAFVLALTADRNIRLDPDATSPRLEACFDTAVQTVNKGEVCETPQPRGRFDEHITHKPPRRTPARRPMKIEVTVTPLLKGRISTFYLYFRTEKSDGVRRIPLKEKGNNVFTATVAGKYLVGKVLRYYMLVDDREGNQIAQFQSVQAPASVDIDDLPTGGSLDGGAADDDDDDTSQEEPEQAEAEPESEPESESESEPEADTSDENLEGGGRRRGGGLKLGISLGSGAGRVTENSIPQTRKKAAVAPGLAPSPFHTLFELDYWFRPDIAVGLYARIQLVDFAHLEGLRFKYRAATSRKNHFVLRGGLGFGHVSHQVPLGAYRDFTLEGPFEYTLGFSWVHDFNRTWAFVVAPDFHHLFGAAPSQHVDLNLGTQISF